tara:strand:+ start:129580 stop:129699 length:120 start_codon:yes stop_codon:yes gene_type:complete
LRHRYCPRHCILLCSAPPSVHAWWPLTVWSTVPLSFPVW